MLRIRLPARFRRCTRADPHLQSHCEPRMQLSRSFGNHFIQSNEREINLCNVCSKNTGLTASATTDSCRKPGYRLGPKATLPLSEPNGVKFVLKPSGTLWHLARGCSAALP